MLSAILILKLIRHFIASILAIANDRMRVVAVLFLKTNISPARATTFYRKVVALILVRRLRRLRLRLRVGVRFW